MLGISHRGGIKNCIFLQLSRDGMDFGLNLPPRWGDFGLPLFFSCFFCNAPEAQNERGVYENFTFNFIVF